MKVLFIISNAGNAADITHFLKSLDYCKAKGISCCVVEVDSRRSLAIAEHIPYKFIQNNESSFLYIKNTYDEIFSFLKAEDFTPDVVEVFDAFYLSYYFIQQKLLGITLADTTQIITHLAEEKLSPMLADEHKTTLPGFFHRTLLDFIIRGSDKVYASSQGIRSRMINPHGLADKIEPPLTLKDNEAFAKKYVELPMEDNHVYPFTSSKHFSFKSGDTPLLSVVIPYYNMGAYIEETVDSVLASSYAHIEILIVNDGSTDASSIEKLNSIKDKSSTITIIDQKNAGVAAARNNGILSAKGEVIALLDADDIVEATYYEKAVKILTKYENVSFVGCWTTLFDETGPLDQWVTYNPEMPLYFLINAFNTQAVVAKKEALVKYGMQDSSLQMVLDDWESVLSMVAHDARGIVIPDFLFRYRIRRNSVYRSHQNRWTRSYEKMINKHFDRISKYSKDLLLLLTTNGPNIFYKDPLWHTDYYKMLNEIPNFRIRNGLLNKWVNRYYNFVELNPVGIKLRMAMSNMRNRIHF